MRQSPFHVPSDSQQRAVSGLLEDGRVVLHASLLLRALSAAFIAACVWAVAYVSVPRLGAVTGVSLATATLVMLVIFFWLHERACPNAIRCASGRVMTWHRTGGPVRCYRLIGYAQFGARLLVLHLALEDSRRAARAVLIAADAMDSVQFHALAVAARRHGRQAVPRRRAHFH